MLQPSWSTKRVQPAHALVQNTVKVTAALLGLASSLHLPEHTSHLFPLLLAAHVCAQFALAHL